MYAVMTWLHQQMVAAVMVPISCDCRDGRHHMLAVSDAHAHNHMLVLIPTHTVHISSCSALLLLCSTLPEPCK